MTHCRLLPTAGMNPAAAYCRKVKQFPRTVNVLILFFRSKGFESFSHNKVAASDKHGVGGSRSLYSCLDGICHRIQHCSAEAEPGSPRNKIFS